jgi:hypothetical protein
MPHIDMTSTERAPLIAKMQLWMAMITITEIYKSDLATTFSLLASHMHFHSLGQIDAATLCWSIHYIYYMDLGPCFSCYSTATLESSIHFPIDYSSGSNIPSLNTYCEANWGPQDASHP